ncbi:hypothetical protein [Thetidibacter halocola]|uniref:Uncharacterized protein n=1 Tax=Thetidibacter halocola TaxID=2827239 RepID=A0A8J8BAD0_9RHOB|nr:hypothetical protein [Thetidibacter halocola]MBS0126420.1 hypothetical protein [Thetidibacter halocola]
MQRQGGMVRSRPGWALLLAVTVAGMATPAAADVPMVFMVALFKVSSIPGILAVLLIEGLALRWIFGFDTPLAMRTAFYANAVSFGVGLLLYPMIGAALYPVLAPIVMKAYGAAALAELAITLGALVILDTLIELPFIGRLRKVRLGLRAWAGFFLANVLGVLALAAFVVDYGALFEKPLPREEVAGLEAHYAPEIAFMHRLLDESAAVYAEHGEIYGTDWVDQVSAEAAAFRFRRLTVARETAMPIVWGEGLHSTSGRRGEGAYYTDDVWVWRTMEQDGIWYYTYELRTSWSPQTLAVRALFDPP